MMPRLCGGMQLWGAKSRVSSFPKIVKGKCVAFEDSSKGVISI